MYRVRVRVDSTTDACCGWDRSTQYTTQCHISQKTNKPAAPARAAAAAAAFARPGNGFERGDREAGLALDLCFIFGGEELVGWVPPNQPNTFMHMYIHTCLMYIYIHTYIHKYPHTYVSTHLSAENGDGGEECVVAVHHLACGRLAPLGLMQEWGMDGCVG